METLCLLAASRPWHKGEAAMLERESGMPFLHAETPEGLMRSLTEAPRHVRYIFFPHWSWILPESIWSRHECVMFHMTDLPFGRGGSPLQNLIARGIAETKISAFRCDSGIDSGPVYMKSGLSLHGSAEEIFLRAKDVVHDMILQILRERPEPQPQQAEPVYFSRRNAADSDIGGLDTLRKIYDHIRMMDADGYPKAFFIKDGYRYEFSRASLKTGKIIADVEITQMEEGQP